MYRMKIEQDTCDVNPRKDFDNFGTLGTYHRRYDFSDAGAPVDVEGAKNLEESYDYFSLPVYMYDHGILSVSTESFVGRAHHAEWDSGQLGIIFVSASDVEKEFGEITKEVEEKVYNILRGEIETLDQYLRGDVWYYQIDKAKVYTAEDGDQITLWDTVDSCGGFYGREYAEEEAKNMLEHYENSSKVSQESADI